MKPAMSEAEIKLLRSVLASSKHYVEFGCGGSTVMAAELVNGPITCVDSSSAWIEKVQDACRPFNLNSCLVDIGELKEWGWPVDHSRRDQWPSYHEKVWSLYPDSTQADTFLVDGRFRVACCLQIILRATANPIIMVHDFERQSYQPILHFSHQIALVDRLVVLRASTRNDVSLREELQEYAFTPD